MEQQAVHFSIVAQLIVEKKCVQHTLLYFNILTSKRMMQLCYLQKMKEKNSGSFWHWFFKMKKKKALSTLKKYVSYDPTKYMYCY